MYISKETYLSEYKNQGISYEDIMFSSIAEYLQDRSSNRENLSIARKLFSRVPEELYEYVCKIAVKNGGAYFKSIIAYAIPKDDIDMQKKRCFQNIIDRLGYVFKGSDLEVYAFSAFKKIPTYEYRVFIKYSEERMRESHRYSDHIKAFLLDLQQVD